MDRQTYAQLDQIEETTQRIEQLVGTILVKKEIETIQGFYEEEIENPKGELHYLVKDQKLKKFIEKLGEEETTEEQEEETTQETEYRQTKF